MARTEEQQKIIDTCVSVLQGGNPEKALVKISAVAGSWGRVKLLHLSK